MRIGLRHKFGCCSIVISGLSAGAALAQQGSWSPGTVVEASPQQMEQFWETCTVREGPDRWDMYKVECGDYVLPVPNKWIRAAPATAAPAPATALPPAPPPRPPEPAAPMPATASQAAPGRPDDAAATEVARGTYECWAFNSARMDLNFEVTAPGSYRASDGSMGKFSYDPATRTIRFSGYLGEAMPDGFTSIYYEPNGRPTVSFRGRSGSEASFCERI